MSLFAWRSLKTRMTLITLAIFLIGIWALAFFTSRMLRHDMERLLGEQQFSTVSFMAAELNDQVVTRLTALGNVAGGITPVMLDSLDTLQALLEQRPLLQSLFNQGVVAFGLDGTAIAEVPSSAGWIGLNGMDIDAVAAALAEGKATIGRPMMSKTAQAPVFAMTVPIRTMQGKVIGALAGVTNLNKPGFLDKIAENRYGKTGNYRLVARRHRVIVTASDANRIMEALPAAGSNFVTRSISVPAP